MNWWTLSMLINTWIILLERGNIAGTLESMKKASETCEREAKKQD